MKRKIIALLIVSAALISACNQQSGTSSAPAEQSVAVAAPTEQAVVVAASNDDDDNYMPMSRDADTGETTSFEYDTSQSPTPVGGTVGTIAKQASANQNCELELRREYEGASKNAYGIVTSSHIDELRYGGIYPPGTLRQFGQNSVLWYLLVTSTYENNQINGRPAFKRYCIVNTNGDVIGIETMK